MERAYCTKYSLVSAPSNGFSKYSDKILLPDATALTRHPGSERAFADIRARKLLNTSGILRKSQSPAQDDCVSILCNMPMQN